MDGRFTDQVTVITRGGAGIGESICRQFTIEVAAGVCYLSTGDAWIVTWATAKTASTAGSR